ncbi:Hypothetical_protein [Hexamita inflata]|uniref:Hypothetical_protein n=1 Tax=Hexamita inflata TaxID=28002 RepID=A0AA86UU40_9EUKA|nr:Hypothetical protein HINF_LOCUS52547 [Hexamita inflata]CAI9964904.1 Hypothetical protein HINF_LOCUS52549 [Hexamita inflata]
MWEIQITLSESRKSQRSSLRDGIKTLHLRRSDFAPEESQIILVACTKLGNNINCLIFCFKQQKYNTKDRFRCVRPGKTGPAIYQCSTVASGVQTHINTYAKAGILMSDALVRTRLDWTSKHERGGFCRQSFIVQQQLCGETEPLQNARR